MSQGRLQFCLIGKFFNFIVYTFQFHDIRGMPFEKETLEDAFVDKMVEAGLPHRNLRCKIFL